MKATQYPSSGTMSGRANGPLAAMSQKMIPPTAPAKPRYRLPLAFSALCFIALFTSCQSINGNKFEDTPAPPVSPTSSISLTPTLRATFTHLPGDIYFLYQTQTAAPTDYPPIRLATPEALTTITPFYTLTALVIELTKSSCLLAYPDFCISPNKRPGCEALADLGKDNFTVLTPDPYDYDKDGDSIGCNTDQ